MSNRFTSGIATAMFFASALYALPAAANPFMMSYGGRLANEAGAGIAGPVNLEVKFYSVASGGTAIGVSPIVKAAVPLNDGVFQIDLSELTQPEYHLVLNSISSTWIEIKDATNNKVYPRQRLTAVPFAMKVPVDGKTVKYDVNGKLITGPGSPATAGQFMTSDPAGNLIWGTPAGSGDMSKSAYDINTNNIVDNSETLDGNSSSFYRNASNINAGTLAYGRLPVGTAASTVAAGDDSRFSDARPPSGAAGGDLVGSYPNPGIAGNSVTSAKIVDGTIVAADIAAGSITDDRLATITAAGKVSGTAITSGGINSSSFIKSSAYISLLNAAPTNYYDADNSNFVGIASPAIVTTNYTMTLPSTIPAAGDFLMSSDASGNLIWSTPTMIPPGAEGEVQFKAGGILATNGAFKWDNANIRLGIGTSTPTGQLHLQNTSNQTNLQIKGFSAQTADFLKIMNNAGATLVAIKSDGTISSEREAGPATMKLRSATNTSDPSTLQLARARGTVGTPTAVIPTDQLGRVDFTARASDASETIGVQVAAFATEGWTAGTKGSRLSLSAVPPGTPSLREAVSIDGNGMFVNGAFKVNYVDASASTGHVVAPTDYIVFLSGSGTGTITLPTCSVPDYGRILKFFRNSGGGTVGFNVGPIGNISNFDANMSRTVTCTSSGWFFE